MSAHAGAMTCSKAEIRQADLLTVKLFGQESLRYLRIKMGLYPKWTGPIGAELAKVCRAGIANAERAGEGSAIFLGLDSELYKSLARSTNSWVSHTGLLFKENNNWVVYESRAPHGAKAPTPICDFIRRSADYRFAIAKVRSGLSSEQIESLKKVAAQESHKDYDYGFDFTNQSREFCSKLTYVAYRELGLEFGRVQSMQEILDSFQGSNEERQHLGCFWIAWIGASKFLSTYRLSIFDWNHLTLTPASQFDAAVAGLYDSSIPFVIVY